MFEILLQTLHDSQGPKCELFQTWYIAVRIVLAYSWIIQSGPCMLRRVFEQLANSRAVTILRYTRCNLVILMPVTAWLMSFGSCIVCGFDSYTALFKCPQRKFLSLHTLKELKDNINHAVAAIQITCYIGYTSTWLDVRIVYWCRKQPLSASSMMVYPFSIWLLY
jgi:hypothetical protein